MKQKELMKILQIKKTKGTDENSPNQKNKKKIFDIQIDSY
jgi:hypothetical protein